MKPYLAIIKDSFREAIVSKMLWVILIICVLSLAVLVPFSVRDVIPNECGLSDIKNIPDFSKVLLSPSKPAEQSISKRISQDTIVALKQELGNFEKNVVLCKEMNSLLRQRDLYDPATMKALLGKDTESYLASQSEMSDENLKQFNRRLLSDVFPSYVTLPEGLMCRVKYFSWELPPVPFNKKSLVMEGFLDYFLAIILGVFGVFIPLLFTSNMIPRTFEAGSIDMLLSKPVNRSWVFLAKYLGGCSFVSIIAAFIVTGLFGILGLRLGIWHWRIFLCIPVFVFHFGVYYCVSAISGLVWRNAIIAIVMSIIFWAICGGLGVTKSMVYEAAYLHSLPKKVIQADDVMTVDIAGQVRRWEPIERRWMECFLQGGGALGMGRDILSRGDRTLVGPIYDRVNKRLLAFYTTRPALLIGRKENNWQQEVGISLPSGSGEFLQHTDGTIYAVSGSKISKLKHVQGNDLFEGCSPDYTCGYRFYSTIHPVTGDIAVSGKRQLVWLKRLNDGSFKIKATMKDLPANRMLITFLGTDLIAVDNKGTVYTFDASLKEIAQETPYKGEAPQQLMTSKDGRTSFILYHNHKVMMLKNNERTLRKAPIQNQGSISSINILPDGALAVAGDIDRVHLYSGESLKRFKGYKPKMKGMDIFYRFGVTPLYAAFPNPSKINNLSTYFVTGKKSHIEGKDLAQFRQRIDLWKPVWSCLIFVVAVLLLGCLNVARRDF